MELHNDVSVDLQCFRCGYDLRAHPPDGKCPECGTSVAQSREVAAIPRRPAWRDSDPRWRRRILAGVWILVLLPLMDALNAFGWASSVPVPALFEIRGAFRTLDDTFLCSEYVYPQLMFCIGVVLLFSKERGRRRGQMDWTRRWGVLCSYVVLLLSAARFLFSSALVMAGVSALFMSMPLKYQPRATRLLVDLSTTYLRYGPSPNAILRLVLVAFSSIAVLLACITLYDALRSSGPKILARILLAPLVLFALFHLAGAGLYWLGITRGYSMEIFQYSVYFWPELLANTIAGSGGLNLLGPTPTPVLFTVEATKWCIVLAIAIWLSIAQLAAWRQRKEMTPNPVLSSRNCR